MAAPAYQWDRWRFEPTEARLLRDGIVVPLAAKTLDLLHALLERAPRLATKEEIMAAVWPDATVEEGNIAFHVAALRKVLDDGEGASAIETVRGKGYRFVRELAIHHLPPTEDLRKDALARAITDAALATAGQPPAPLAALPSPPAPPPERRRRVMVAGLGIVLVLIAGIGAFAWLRSRPEPPTIAVQTFTVVSPLPGQENFPDGLRAYVVTKVELAGITIRPQDSATAALSGQLYTLDGGFRVTVQLTRRADNRRVWDWSFVIPYDTDLPHEGKDDARSRLQGAIASRVAEGVRDYLNLSADVLVTR